MEISDVVYRHPWIDGRFCLKDEYYDSFTPGLIGKIEEIIGDTVYVDSYDFCINQNPPITNIQIVHSNPLSLKEEQYVNIESSRFGMQCACFLSKGMLIISLWAELPEDIVYKLNNI